MKYLCFLGLVLCIFKLSRCVPYNSSVISKYARVSMWGKNNTDISDTRNIRGNMRNHRLDPEISSPITKKKNLSIAYQYPVYEKPERQYHRRIEHVPGIGEVIVASAQDRFEARPLFAYRNQFKSATYGPPPKLSTAAAPTSGATIPTVPSLTQPVKSEDLYNSPFSSYNPPNYTTDDSDFANLYPPNIPSSPESSSITSPVQTPVSEAKANTPDSYASLGPPLVSYDDGKHNQGQDHLEYSGYEQHDHAPPQDSMSMHKYHDGPPQDPPKSIDDVYYPPDFPKYYDIRGNGDMMQKVEQIMMQPDDEKSNAGNDSPDDQGMIPPPSHDYEHSHAFPPYLYDNHHYDHHVYEEVPHTTMAPAKEDKRVSSTNYSYYYLGRKLWYIPLYFSIYFIIYVTVLILKSIARHKVRLKYKWYEHDTSAKQARSMNLYKYEELTNLHHDISLAVKNATEKYNSVIAM